MENEKKKQANLVDVELGGEERNREMGGMIIYVFHEDEAGDDDSGYGATPYGRGSRQ